MYITGHLSLSLSLSLFPFFNLSFHHFKRIDANFVIKVADFGLAESIDVNKEYFRQDEHFPIRLPLKWLALESITDYIFSEKTDVVSNNLLCHFIL